VTVPEALDVAEAGLDEVGAQTAVVVVEDATV
jgi:hypothetical protein